MKLEGVVPILPTPFTPDEAVDESQIPAMVEFAVRSGVSAIGVPAFGSEFYKLSGAERTSVIKAVLKAVGGRLPVIVQCNHCSPKVVAAMAAEAAEMGASCINTAIPRQFPASEGQLLDFAEKVCNSVSLPVILQDWNPGGATIGIDFIRELSRRCQNFSLVKYEEPGIGPLIQEIEQATNGQVGTFTGWGASYMLELIPAGSRGIMPGLPLVDYFGLIWRAIIEGRMPEAYRLYARIAPYIAFSLQNFEQFHHTEKHLLVRRGLLKAPVVRSVSIEMNRQSREYMNLVIDETCRAIEEAGLRLLL